MKKILILIILLVVSNVSSYAEDKQETYSEQQFKKEPVYKGKYLSSWIIKLKSDEIECGKRDALEALRRIKHKKSIPYLIEFLRNETDEIVCDEAISVLIEIGTPSLDVLLDALNDNNSNVRAYATLALGHCNNHKVMSELAKALKDIDVKVRRGAAYSLRMVFENSKPELYAIIDLLKLEKDEIVRAFLYSALAKAGHKEYIIKLIQMANNDNDLLIVDILKDIGWDSVPFIIDALKTKQDISLIYVLGQMKAKNALLVLRTLLTDSKKDVRCAAAYSLGEIGSKSVVADLINLLGDSAPEVRSAAVYALGEIGSRKAISAIINLIKDLDSEVRKSAAYALGNIGDKMAVPALMSVAKDQDSSVVAASKSALWRIGKAAYPALFKVINSEDKQMRMFAVRVFEAKPIKKVGDVLLCMLNDKDEDVHSLAIYLLAHFGGEYAMCALRDIFKNEKDERIGTAVFLWMESAVRNIRKSDILELMNMLKASKNRTVRENIIRILGNCRDKVAVPLLIDILIKTPLDDFYGSASRALKKIGKEGVPALIDVLNNPDKDLRKAVIDILYDITGRNFGEDQVVWRKWWAVNK